MTPEAQVLQSELERQFQGLMNRIDETLGRSWAKHVCLRHLSDAIVSLERAFAHDQKPRKETPECSANSNA